MGIDIAKMPSNIVENFGNSSGSCVGVNISYNLGKSVLKNQYKCCLSGFGGGLAWVSALMNIGHMRFNDLVIADL